MNTRKLTPDERFNLTIECRQSGLTDHQWLEEKGIAISTFYDWISRLKKMGYTNIPEPLGQHRPHKAQRQEVVKLDFSRQPAYPEQNIPICNGGYSLTPSVEIVLSKCIVRIANDAEPDLVEAILRGVGGMV